jgi:hypothetical protein
MRCPLQLVGGFDAPCIALLERLGPVWRAARGGAEGVAAPAPGHRLPPAALGGAVAYVAAAAEAKGAPLQPGLGAGEGSGQAVGEGAGEGGPVSTVPSAAQGECPEQAP